MEIGISGYGAYIPRLRIKVDDIARVWGQNGENVKNGLLVEEKAVPEADEDTITIAAAAGRNALLRAGIEGQRVGALFIGSESHPYAVKPSGTVVADVLEMGPEILVADYEFACKAGTAGMQACVGLVKSGEIEYGMAIGADTAQSQPGDALEYTAAAGGAAYIIGKDPVAVVEGMYSYTSDTPDFWRREGEHYPKHGGRFTGEPAYFGHLIPAARGMMQKMGTKPSDYAFTAFHTPNGKFPLRAGKVLGFSQEQLKFNLLVKQIGNTYSGASMLVLTYILDNAKPGDRILMTSYGSGAGSDSFSLVVTDAIERVRDLAPSTEHYVRKKSYIDYANYARLRGKIRL